MKKYFKRTIFDRYDGWRVTKIDAVYAVIPFIMRTRLDCQNYYSQDINYDIIHEFIRKHKADLPDLSTIDVIMAALVRLISQRPYLNRFVIWNKIYARNSIQISMMIKRTLDEHGEETLIKPEFEPEDTLYEVVEKVKKAILASKPQGAKNDMDHVANVFRYIPPFVVRIGLWIVRCLDNMGLMPRLIEKASPFHCSMFITNLASLRIEPIHHHLYEFGNCSAFMAIGKPRYTPVATSKNKVETARMLGAKYVLDERICDGFYYASAMKYFYSLLENPERLLVPPEQVIVDDGVLNKRLEF